MSTLNETQGRIWFWVIVTVMAISAFIGLQWFLNSAPPKIGGISTKTVGILIVLVYIVLSISSTKMDQTGIKLFWGKPLYTVGPGQIVFLPMGFFWLEIATHNIHQQEVPGEPEQIWRGKDSNNKELPLGIGRDGKRVEPPVGKQWVHPIFVVFDDKNLPEDEDPVSIYARDTGQKFNVTPATRSSDTTDNGSKEDVMTEVEDPTIKRITAEVPGAIKVEIDKTRLLDFYGKFGSIGPEGLAKAAPLIADNVSSEMTAVLQLGTVGRTLANQALISGYIQSRIQASLGKLGITIVEFQLKATQLSHTLNASLQSIAEAKAEAAVEVHKARGYKQSQELRGEGDAGRIIKIHEAVTQNREGAAYAYRQDALKVGEQLAASPNSKILLFDSNKAVGQVAAAVVAGKELLVDNPLTPLPAPPSNPSS